jgi:abortive infection bacteriophage resistance protein
MKLFDEEYEEQYFCCEEEDKEVDNFMYDTSFEDVEE